jgi:hypothetical protein
MQLDCISLIHKVVGNIISCLQTFIELYLIFLFCFLVSIQGNYLLIYEAHKNHLPWQNFFPLVTRRTLLMSMISSHFSFTSLISHQNLSLKTTGGCVLGQTLRYFWITFFLHPFELSILKIKALIVMMTQQDSGAGQVTMWPGIW